MASATQVFHNFYWGGRDHYAGQNVSFHGDNFLSWRTTVGFKFQSETDKRTNIVLTSIDCMSGYTSRHLNKLCAAAPPDWVRLHFPFKFDVKGWTLETIKRGFLDWATNTKPERMSRSEERFRFNALLESFRVFVEHVEIGKRDLRKALENIDKVLEAYGRYESRGEKLNATRALREAEYNENRERRREERVAAIKGVIGRIERIPYPERIAMTFDTTRFKDRPKDVKSPMWAEYRRYLLGTMDDAADHDYGRPRRRDCRWREKKSYFWLKSDGVTVKTSQGVEVPVEEVREAYRIFDSRGLQALIDAHVFPYYVRGVEGGVMTIGCHHIPMENVEAMRDLITKEKP